MTIQEILTELDKTKTAIWNLECKDFEDLKFLIKEYSQLIDNLETHEDLNEDTQNQLDKHQKELDYFLDIPLI